MASIATDDFDVRTLEEELAALVWLVCSNVLDAHEILASGDLCRHLEGELFLAPDEPGRVRCRAALVAPLRDFKPRA